MSELIVTLKYLAISHEEKKNPEFQLLTEET